MTIDSFLLPELALLNELVFKPLEINLSNLKKESESQEYSAHTFDLGGFKVVLRIAKITPTKKGQFVTLWKRNEQGLTAPFDIKDETEIYLIVTKTDSHFGVFIFPKKVLHGHQILSDSTRDGKRGIRVYPIWDETISKQAQKTQRWQTEYFLDLSDANQIDLNRAKDLLTI